MRLHSLPAGDFYGARNTLCQRPLGPECSCTVGLDTANLATSDTAGLALLSAPYAWIGVVKTPGGLKLQVWDHTGAGGHARRTPGHHQPGHSAQPSLAVRRLQLRHRRRDLQLERRR